MERVYEFNLNRRVYDLICKRIKTKSHLIELLVELSSLIISNVNLQNDKYGKCILRSNTRQRVYFSVKDDEKEVYKHFSFAFPFRIFTENDLFNLETTHGNVKIQHSHLAVLRTMCSNYAFDERQFKYGILLDFVELVEQIFNDLGLEFQKYENEFNQILKECIMFEPGYIRFDNDEKNENGRIHPLNHIDIFYSQVATFKLGCSLMELNDFINILEPYKECKYIG